MEWKSDSDLFGSTDGSSQEEWAVIDAVGYKPEKLTQPGGGMSQYLTLEAPTYLIKIVTRLKLYLPNPQFQVGKNYLDLASKWIHIFKSYWSMFK